MIRNQMDFKGLNTRTSDLKMDPSFASTIDNMELTNEGYLTTINGYSTINSTNADGFMQLITHYNADGVEELLGVKTSGLYKYDTTLNTWTLVICPNNDAATIGFTVPLSYTSVDGILYLADPAKSNNPLKYVPKTVLNGAVAPYIYLMGGMPAKVLYSSFLGSSSVAGPYTLLFVYRFEDTISYFGDYSIVEGVASITNYFSPNQHDYDNSDPRYAYMPRDRADIDVVKMELLCFVSTTSLYGFRFVKKFDFGYMSHITSSTSSTNLISVSAPEIAIGLAEGYYLADIYDVASTKRMPPTLAKYITNHNGILVFGDFADDNAVYASTDVPIPTKNPNGVIWSDTSTGGSVENFPALNSDSFGRADYGITGLFSEADNLVVFKQKQVFYMSGSLFDFNYRIRDAQAEQLGCISHRSIYSIKGVGVYLTAKGLYLTAQGGKPTEFTDLIENQFKDPNLILSEAVTYLDRLNEKVQFFIPAVDGNNKIFQYDLYHNIWSTKSGIDATGGIINFQDTIYFSDGVDVYTFNAGYSFNGNPITTTYRSVWLLEGDATLKKKFTYLDLITMYSGSVNCTVNYYRDWSNTLHASATKLVGTDSDYIFPLPVNFCKALKFEIISSTTTEPLVISGINYEVTGPQTRMKGEQ